MSNLTFKAQLFTAAFESMMRSDRTMEVLRKFPGPVEVTLAKTAYHMANTAHEHFLSLEDSAYVADNASFGPR